MSSPEAPSEPEIAAENDLLTRLTTFEKLACIECQNAVGSDLRNVLADVATLVRAYRRKWHEANDMKEHLAGILGFLKESWHEEESDFDPPYSISSAGHWCPDMIEEIENTIDDSVVYTPHLVPHEGGDIGKVAAPTPRTERDQDDEDE
jgi:hypothetical protein